MSFSDDLAAIAVSEWDRWGGPRIGRDGRKSAFASDTMERDDPYAGFVGDYWRAVNATRTGRDDVAWSGAFISHCFRTAGAGKAFPYRENHSRYCARIAGGLAPGLSLEDPEQTMLEVGDVVWKARSGADCRTPPASYAQALDDLALMRAGKRKSFCSHSDIVVALRPGEVDIVGGNVAQAVTLSTLPLDAWGRLENGHLYLGVIRNGL